VDVDVVVVEVVVVVGVVDVVVVVGVVDDVVVVGVVLVVVVEDVVVVGVVEVVVDDVVVGVVLVVVVDVVVVVGVVEVVVVVGVVDVVVVVGVVDVVVVVGVVLVGVDVVGVVSPGQQILTGEGASWVHVPDEQVGLLAEQVPDGFIPFGQFLQHQLAPLIDVHARPLQPTPASHLDTACMPLGHRGILDTFDGDAVVTAGGQQRLVFGSQTRLPAVADVPHLPPEKQPALACVPQLQKGIALL